jgi:Uncharacterized proteins of the AP superfamily
MNIKNLSKTNTLVNLANSILKFYGCETYHDSLKEIDDLLVKSGRKKICLFLFDAFGACILEKYKEAAPYMYDHRFMVINSVFPTTTVAATTAITTGRYPIETGYMGWCQYFSKANKTYEVFSSKNWCNPLDKFPVGITNSILKINYITDDINKKANKTISSMVMSFNYESKLGLCASNRKWEKYVEESLKNNLFTYAYNINPDHLMHVHGTKSTSVKHVIKNINHIVKHLTKKYPDTLFLCISDHGMVDTEFIQINSIPGFVDCLKRDCITIETRASTFFVKEDKKEDFLKIYHNTPILKDNFYIQDREEVLANHIFGYTDKANRISLDTIGDFTLFAHEKYCLTDRYHDGDMKASHAGMTDDEINIYLQAYNCD